MTRWQVFVWCCVIVILLFIGGALYLYSRMIDLEKSQADTGIRAELKACARDNPKWCREWAKKLQQQSKPAQ